MKGYNNMNVYEAVLNRRTVRKFTDKAISGDMLLRIIDCARLTAYGANMQPLKFMTITDEDLLNSIFPLTKWAGYLSDGTPKENERPTAYFAIIGDSTIKANRAYETEAGAAAAVMALEATELGLGSCQLGAINRPAISQLLELNEKYDLLYLLALGYPAQTSKAVEMKDNNVKYYEDENGIINVPKRSLEDIILK